MAVGTSRIEAFSDGVFAIAITLLILEIRLPHAGVEGGLWTGLVALWPSYLAFALSFFVILVTWIAHHDLMRLVPATTRPIQLANGFVLLYVTFIPFPTAVLAANLGGSEVSTAVAFYCGTFVIGGGAFNLLVATIARGQLFRPEVDAQIIGGIRRSFRIVFLIYVATTLLALVMPWLALALKSPCGCTCSVSGINRRRQWPDKRPSPPRSAGIRWCCLTGAWNWQRTAGPSPSPLSANVDETPNPRKFSVKGESGFPDVHDDGGPAVGARDRSDGEGPAASVHGCREAAGAARSGPLH
jgi:uncharacterized membrane protein